MDKMRLCWIKLTTTNEDSYGSIYVYINVDTLASISRFKNLTNVRLTNGEHYTVVETPTEIINKVQALYDANIYWGG